MNHVLTIAKGYCEASGVRGDYRKHLHPARLLLARCDGSLDYALEKVRACRNWARDKDVSWSLYTVLNHFHELNIGSEKQKTIIKKNGPEKLSDILKCIKR